MVFADVEQRMALLAGTLDHADLAGCDLVLEAVFESMDIKRAVCTKLGEVCKPGAIIATNTSTLDVDALAAATGRAADVVGMHFFSPANVMRLLEVVRGAATAPDVLATVMALAKRIRKVAVVSGVCYGFIGNRMLDPYLREAEFMLLEGATPQQIDQALERFGMAMGPCRMMDMAGVDVCAKVVIERAKDGRLPDDPNYRVVCSRLFELGRHGQKTGHGFYAYDGRTPLPDPEVDAIVAALAAERGISRRASISENEIVERCLYPLINEGAKILEEGIAYRPGDIDIVWIAGYGFPTQKGGPMHHAGEIGLAHVHSRLLAHGKAHGDAHGYWRPSALLTRLAASARQVRRRPWRYRPQTHRMTLMREAVIVSTARTPIGRAFRGALNNIKSPTLMAHAIRHAVDRARVDGGEIDDVVIGTVLSAGTAGMNVARNAALAAGVPVTAAAQTIDRQCSSGLMAIAIAAKQIIVDGMQVIVAGGQDNISARAEPLSRMGAGGEGSERHRACGARLHADAADRGERRPQIRDQPRGAGRIRAVVAAAHREGPAGGPLRRRDRADRGIDGDRRQGDEGGFVQGRHARARTRATAPRRRSRVSRR